MALNFSSRKFNSISRKSCYFQLYPENKHVSESSQSIQAPSDIGPSVAEISPSARHLAFLDAMRGVAVLGVILVHSGTATLTSASRLGAYTFAGQRGVELFYMVSAFTLFLARDVHQGKEHFPVSNFFIRRFCRIAPLFYTAIALNLLFQALHVYPAPATLTYFDFGTALCFINAWNPIAFNNAAIGGWSVAIESMFYFILPFLYRKIMNLRDAAALLVGSIVVCSVVTKIATHTMPAYGGYFVNWFPVHFPIFAFGIAGYFLWKGFCNQVRYSDVRSVSLVLLTASALLVLACIPIRDANLYANSIALMIFVMSCALHPWKLIVNPFTVYLGKISFSIYLLHFFVVLLGERLLHLFLLRQPALEHHAVLTPFFFLFSVGLSIPLCALSWRYIEQPGIRFGRRWITARELHAAIPMSTVDLARLVPPS
jgi:peptidoglycan/LPS O-acetylase OafA/YrhL